ncbi:hypothetical protein EDD29_4068 [Actinocorallia herbida]|uniref:Uncharacterized protein n=1 Tax=Actinocorallia herbida TaxID=58109 RepID=A0A3N1CZ42_9ACTN|nr:hypothetical protein [Actinocorallia herbida]ROO86496.1 hypothetical protein EDD29_4068 [Actinocorallia herbida]
MPIWVERSEVYPLPEPPDRGAVVAAPVTGLLLAAGPLMATVGRTHEPEGGGVTYVEYLTRLPYLAALLALCVLAARSGAAGPRLGRRIAWAALGPLVGALGATFAIMLVGLAMDTEDRPEWLAGTRPVWLAAQAGVLAVGLAIARTGRWHGPARWLPLAGALSLPVEPIGRVLALEDAAAWLLAAWAGATYTVLGVILLIRPPATTVPSDRDGP